LGYLSDSNNTSRWERIKCGVPQGLILGPLLFLFNINGLPKIVNKPNNVVRYADDASIIVTDTDKLNFETFNNINTWLNSNLLTLNFEKTQYLEFQSMKCGSTITHIIYDQKTISRGTETRFLVLIIDDALSWKHHIDQVVNRLALQNVKYLVSFARQIYFAYAQSIISYGIILWDGSSSGRKVFI
jgi:hypothetical protein